MIVAMKKVFLLMRQAQVTSSLDDLRALGLVHVEHENVPQGQELNEISEKLNLIGQARSILLESSQKQVVKHIMQKSENWAVVCHHLIDLQKRYDQLKEYSVTLSSGIGLWEHWGDFDPGQIKALQQKNIYLKFYQIPQDKIKSLPQGILLKKISAEGAQKSMLLKNVWIKWKRMFNRPNTIK